MSHSAAATSPECRCKTDIWTAAARSCHVGSTTTSLDTAVYYRIQYKLCLLMYFACHQHCPAYISNVVQSVATSTHRQGLRSSTCPTYVVPKTRTKLGERAFSVSGPVAWNALPANNRSTADSKLFKRPLNRHFSISRLISLRKFSRAQYVRLPNAII